MSYNYQSERASLFTEQGQIMFLKVRDQTQRLLKTAGAARSQEMMATCGSGSSWEMMACVDRLVELGEIREVTANVWGQHRVFISATE